MVIENLCVISYKQNYVLRHSQYTTTYFVFVFCVSLSKNNVKIILAKIENIKIQTNILLIIYCQQDNRS